MAVCSHPHKLQAQFALSPLPKCRAHFCKPLGYLDYPRNTLRVTSDTNAEILKFENFVRGGFLYHRAIFDVCLTFNPKHILDGGRCSVTPRWLPCSDAHARPTRVTTTFTSSRTYRKQLVHNHILSSVPEASLYLYGVSTVLTGASRSSYPHSASLRM